MLKRKKILIIFTVFLLFLVLLSSTLKSSDKVFLNQNTDDDNNLNLSGSLEGSENILITRIYRKVNMSINGLLHYEDRLTIKNLNNNPISSIFIGIPLTISDDLVFFEGKGSHGNTLLAERSYMIIDEYEMIVIYFDSPLLPLQSKSIFFIQTYKDLLTYNVVYSLEETNQEIIFNHFLFPILPYKAEGDIEAFFQLPEGAINIESATIAVVDDVFLTVQLFFEDIQNELGIDSISPFLENLENRKKVRISYYNDRSTKMELLEINREIFLSPWGTIKIKDNYLIKNLGVIDINYLDLKLPLVAKNIYVSDSLGEIIGITVSKSTVYKNLRIQLTSNRITLKPNSSFEFDVQYYLPFEKYISLNWFEESIKLDIFTTDYEYLGREQTIKIIIEGCQEVYDITIQPEAIDNTRNAVVLIYKNDLVSPLENNILQFTFTINIFETLLRPIIFILIISLILSSFVFLVKLRKREEDSTIIRKEIIPVNEIREFCSLYEEKNALLLEIRKTEEDAKRKKIAKKRYKNLLDKNTLKIEEIQKEIIPFKKTIIEINEIFENIMKKLDILEAERLSVGDSLNLLETRYKRGRLPSRAAYLKLSEDFKKRRKKIDRNIDKFTQQLRSYLL